MNKLIKTTFNQPQIDVLNKIQSHQIWNTSSKDANYSKLIKECIPLFKEHDVNIKTLDEKLQSNYQTALTWSYNQYSYWKQSVFMSMAIALLIFDAYKKTIMPLVASAIALALAIMQFVRYNNRKDKMLTHKELDEYSKFASIVNDINCAVVTNKIEEKW